MKGEPRIGDGREEVGEGGTSKTQGHLIHTHTESKITKQ